jgi:hypothetical protein
MLLASEATVRGAAESASTLWELHPDPDHLTRGAARELVTDMRALAALAGEPDGGDAAPAPVVSQPDPGLTALIDQADGVGDAVARGLIGVRLVAVAIAIGLLAVAAAAVVRTREAELRLRLSRGERPIALALRIAERQAAPALAGTVVGAVAAYAAVRALGPAPDIEVSATTRAAILATVGLLLAIGTVAAVGARRADTLVDHAPRPRRRFTPPWELVPLALAAVALARLDRASGIRIVGTPDPGGDGLADAFPVLTVVAAGAILVRPLRWLLSRGRRGGGHLSPALLLGWRRLGADPGRYAVLGAAVVAGVAATIVASSLGLTTDRMVRDKATTFLGSDLRVVTAGEPVIPDGRAATPVSRVAARAGGAEVQVVGIDPDSFAAAVHWRDDASDYPLAELLAVLEVDDMRGAPLPAIVVGGPVPSATLVADGDSAIDITPVATARFFPGKTAVPLVIVNRDALAADEVPAAAEIWWHDPPADATRELAAVGNLVRGSQGTADVFDTGSVQAVRWTRQAMWAFAVFVAAAALVGSLHIAATRRHERQAARALARHIGEPAHQELVAALFAAAVPSAIGAAAGLAAGAATIRLLADQLDTAGNLPPPARIAYDLAPAGAATAVAIGLVIVVAITSRALVVRRRVGEVIARVQHV